MAQSGRVDPFEQALVDDRVVDDDPVIVERVAAIDVGKAQIMVCVRVPRGAPGRAGRRQLVRSFGTMTRELFTMTGWLKEHGVTRVAMESTGDYWRSPYYVLEAQELNPMLVNASDVKHLPGRSKTDRLDAVWLCKLAERGMLRSSFVPPAPVRELRSLTRYRANTVAARTAEKQRVEKLLEDAQIKLSVVASDIFGVSGRHMLEALIGGERDETVMAELAMGRMRPKRDRLREALIGRFNDNHAFLLATMLSNIDRHTATIESLDARIEVLVDPFEPIITRLREIPGIERTTAVAVIAEIGVDMTQFPTSGHLTSWAGYAPKARSSAGRAKGRQKTSHGNRYLAAALGEAAISAAVTTTFLGARYRRLVRRTNSKSKAQVAVGRSILVIVWQLISDPEAHFTDLGNDWYDQRRNTNRQRATHVHALEALGYTVTLEPVAS